MLEYPMLETRTSGQYYKNIMNITTIVYIFKAYCSIVSDACTKNVL